MKTQTPYAVALANFAAGHYGSTKSPRLGAMHRCAFWAGFNGIKYPGAVPGSIASAHWRAGKRIAQTIKKSKPARKRRSLRGGSRSLMRQPKRRR